MIDEMLDSWYYCKSTVGCMTSRQSLRALRLKGWSYILLGQDLCHLQSGSCQYRVIHERLMLLAVYRSCHIASSWYHASGTLQKLPCDPLIYLLPRQYMSWRNSGSSPEEPCQDTSMTIENLMELSSRSHLMTGG